MSSSRAAISKAGLDALIEEATVDCYNAEEEVAGLFTTLEDHLALPFEPRCSGCPSRRKSRPHRQRRDRRDLPPGRPQAGDPDPRPAATGARARWRGMDRGIPPLARLKPAGLTSRHDPGSGAHARAIPNRRAITSIVAPCWRIRTSSLSRSEFTRAGASPSTSIESVEQTHGSRSASAMSATAFGPIIGISKSRFSGVTRRSPTVTSPMRCSAFSHRRRRIDRSNASWSAIDSARIPAIMTDVPPQRRTGPGPARPGPARPAR